MPWQSAPSRNGKSLTLKQSGLLSKTRSFTDEIFKVHFKGAVALSNIFCWAAALLYAQMGAKSVVISPHPL